MDYLNALIDFCLRHWVFFAATFIFATAGQVMKQIFTKERAEESKFFWLMRATMPLHPVLAGIALGLSGVFPPEEGIQTRPHQALYFGAAGVLSSYAFDLVKRLGPEILAFIKGLLSKKLEEDKP